ncbi:MAG: hypothetical protein FWG73_06895 [Planctomycetaceae bacterium]|nr:hypothetical protein [Planctomycetaceae bacterium]
MTKIDWSKYPVIPGFDSLKWKRETQRKIYEETNGMTWEEQRERLHQVSERAAVRRKAFAERRAEEAQK